MIGRELCGQLAGDDSGFDRVVALTRRPLDFSFPRLVSQQADMGRLDALDPIGPVDAAFCALGTTIKIAGSPEAFRLVDYDYVVAFARFAKGAGARTFVLLTSVGADVKSRHLYLRVKGEVELAVEAVGFQSLYVFRPGFLIGERRQVREGERLATVVSMGVGWALVGPLRKYRAITGEAVAEGMVSAAVQASPGRHDCHYDDIVRLAIAGS